MHCCLWFRSVFRVRGPWPKRYGHHLSIFNLGLCIIIIGRIFVIIAHPQILRVRARVYNAAL